MIFLWPFGDVFEWFRGTHRSSGHRLASDAFWGDTKMPRDSVSAASALQSGLRWDLARSHWLNVFAKLDLSKLGHVVLAVPSLRTGLNSLSWHFP